MTRLKRKKMMQLVEVFLGTVDVNVPAIRGLKHCNVGLYYKLPEHYMYFSKLCVVKSSVASCESGKILYLFYSICMPFRIQSYPETMPIGLFDEQLFEVNSEDGGVYSGCSLIRQT